MSLDVNYLCKGGNVFLLDFVCLSVCVCVCVCVNEITEKVMDRCL